MVALLHTLAESLPRDAHGPDPGDAGWGDVIFVTIWAICTLMLAAYYCYKSYFSR